MLQESAPPRRNLPTAAVAGLRERVRGTVLEPGDAAYADTATIWNRQRQQQPRVIVLAGSAQDVPKAIGFAREHELRLAVRTSGFCPAGYSTCDDGLVLDLRRLRAVRIDSAAEQITVQGGTRWGEVDVAAQRLGRIVPGAAVTGLGVAGSTLTGGAGHLRRAYGLACDNLTAATVVGADGTTRTTAGDERPDLLWGLRGGGGNFGVATSLTFRLRPLPDPVVSGTIFFAAEAAERLLGFYCEWTRRLRDDVSTTLSFYGPAHSPALTELIGVTPPAPLVGVTVVCAGHPAETRAVIRSLRAAGPALRDLVEPRPFAVFQQLGEALHPFGIPSAMDSGYLDDLDDAVVAALLDRFHDMVAASSELHLRHMGGAVGRVARMSTAVPNRGARFDWVALSRWAPGNDEVGHRNWVTGTGDRLRPLQSGGPQPGMRSTPASSVDVFGAERYLRLAVLKRRYDPDNVFTLNQNASPLV